MRASLFTSILLTACLAIAQSNIDQRVDSLLSLMNLDEKIGQMTQAEHGALESITDIQTYYLGSLLSGGGSGPPTNSVEAWGSMYDAYQSQALQTRLGIPLIYGIDAVHGHNNVYGAVIHPHNIGLGCTWNPELVTELNRITAREVAATGIDWTFAPAISVVRDERWGRSYEGFGETPEIQRIMSEASVRGLQGDSLGLGETILACAKHFVGDGGTEDGIDQGNAIMNEEELRNIHLLGYIDAIEANVGTVMASYNSWNGQKLHGYKYLLTDVLKTELGFEGFIISDWAGVDQVNGDYRTAIKQSINAGIDMVMVPNEYRLFINHMKDLVGTGEIPMTRIDDAVRRILKQKLLLRLFEEPLTDQSLIDDVGSMQHRLVARQAVSESMVILSSKNNILPLEKDGQTILLAGTKTNDLGAQCGGWSISWQGANGDITEGTTVLEAFNQVAGTNQIIHAPDGQTLEHVDIAVVVIGEDPYAEGAGDRTSLDLDPGDVDLIKSIKERGIPVITILISGRPMIIGDALPYTDAFIAAWLPGTEGNGITDVLFGDTTPRGLLTNTWPRSMAQIPINVGDQNYDPLFEYRHGIQEFLTSSNNPSLETYAGIIAEEGNKLLLVLNDEVETLDYQNSDFTLSADGSGIPVVDVQIATYDQSILEITLNQLVQPEASHILLSYSGNGIASGSATLGTFVNYQVENNAIDFGDALTIPGIIEAEDFSRSSDVGIESTTDINGGSNVGWIDAGDWMEYNVDVTTPGIYDVTARIASQSTNGTLDIAIDGITLETINYESTGGWQSWRSFNGEVDLNAGNHIMRLSTPTGGMNLNYIEFVKTILSEPEREHAIELFPNPAQERVTIKSPVPILSVTIMNLSGQLVSRYDAGNKRSYTIPVLTAIPGIYFLKIQTEQEIVTRKLIIE